MSSTSPPSTPSPPALAAFLRGLERRAAILAELQAGDAVAGDAAVAAAMRQWHAAAADTTMGEWPQQFWTQLLAQPQLRERTPVSLALDATDRLGELGAGPRAALLLRLAAGLDEPTAAAVLGVPAGSYRLALHDTLPRAADGSPDHPAWQRLSDEVHRRIRTLPPERLLRLGRAREAAAQCVTPGASAMPVPGVDGPKANRLLLVGLWTLLALCVLALAATFLPGSSAWLGAGDADPARGITALPDAPAASHFGPEAALVAHRDFALLADPAAALAQDLAFHSWLAAQPELLASPPAPVAAVDENVAESTGAAAGALDPRRTGRNASESADAPG